MDPRKIKSTVLSREEIWERAEDFREHNIFNYDLPVDIERVAQATLGIKIVTLPGLQKENDIDGFMSTNFRFLYLDNDLYKNPRQYHRIRFTIAHEIGHYILHRSLLDGVSFASAEEWKEFFNGIDNTEMSWIEFQANEFAGRLLVPLDSLVEDFKKFRDDINRKNSGFYGKRYDLDELINLVAPLMCDRFDVSSDVIKRRLQYDKVLDLLGLK